MAETVASLVTQLSAANVDQRLQAAEALGQMGEEAQGAALALVRACADDAAEVRETASGALESLGPPAPADVQALTELLADANADVAYWAATLLGRLGADAAGSVPALVKILAQCDAQSVRERAAWALGQIGPTAKDAVEALEEAAKHPSPRLARLAQEALDSIRS
jgi:HEAT repeat protein